MFEYFTERGRAAVTASQDEAVALGHDFIGTEHILLGLVVTEEGTAAQVLRELGVDAARTRAETVRICAAAGVATTGGQPAKDALSSLGIDVDAIQAQADGTFGPGAFQYPRPAYAADAKAALERTLAEARALGQERFGTEHILLGLLSAGEGRGPEVLAALGADGDEVRRAVLARAGS